MPILAAAAIASAQLPAVFQAETPLMGRWDYVYPLAVDINRDGYLDILALGLDSAGRNLTTFLNDQGKGWTIFRATLSSQSEVKPGKPMLTSLDSDDKPDILINWNESQYWFLPDFPAQGAQAIRPDDFLPLDSIDGKHLQFGTQIYGQGFMAWLNWSVGRDPVTQEEITPRSYSIHPVTSVDTANLIDEPGTMPLKPLLADFNMDGKPDGVALRGYYSKKDTCLFRRSGPEGYETIPFPGLSFSAGSLEAGDYDNDGDLDIVASGMNFHSPARAFFEYQEGGFQRVGFEDGFDYQAPGYGASLLADLDNDGDLDMFTLGKYTQTRVHRNLSSRKNAAPSIPTGLGFKAFPDSMFFYFAWNRSRDDLTPAPGLTYNVRVGTSPGLGDVFDAFADPATGRLLTPHFGNAGSDTLMYWPMGSKASPAWNPGTYYWTVQAIDNGYAASAFAPVQAFTVKADGTVRSLDRAGTPKVRKHLTRKLAPGRKPGLHSADGRITR